jgi:hypothetical protein
MTVDPVVDGIWNNDAKPLLESLIKINRVPDAEDVMRDLAKLTAFRDFQRRAAELALECGREDLQKTWLALDIPEKPKGADLDDLDAKMNIYSNSRLILAVANGEQFGDQIRSLINQDRIIGYGLSSAILNAELSELLQKREGWPEKEARWALFDNKGKSLAAGQGLPSEDAIHRAIESTGLLTLAGLLRRFVSEHPSQFEAKVTLLGELKRLAEQATGKKLGSDAGTNKTAMLSDDDDRDIWGEYAFLYGEVLAYLIEQGRPHYARNYLPYCLSNYFIHSQRMKAAVRSALGQIEAGLRRQPFDGFLWNCWTDYASQMEYRHFMALKETVVLPPFTPSMNDTIPPHVGLRSVMRSKYVRRADWLGLIDFHEWRWEGAMRDPKADLSRTFWWQEWSHLLEAYLRLGMDGKANDFVRDMTQSSDAWEKNKQAVIDLAKKCEKDTLAERWGRL